MYLSLTKVKMKTDKNILLETDNSTAKVRKDILHVTMYISL
jgi:hypothetical protein